MLPLIIPWIIYAGRTILCSSATRFVFIIYTPTRTAAAPTMYLVNGTDGGTT